MVVNAIFLKFILALHVFNLEICQVNPKNFVPYSSSGNTYITPYIRSLADLAKFLIFLNENWSNFLYFPSSGSESVLEGAMQDIYGEGDFRTCPH